MTPSQLTDFLQFAIKHKEPVLIKGAPGVGKSDIVAKACALAKADLIISHPVVADPTDYKGLPFPSEDKTEANFLPFGDLKKLINAQKPTVFFLDDMGQAPPSVQAACFPAGAAVMTANGVKNIEDIQIGEFVIDDNGRANKVTESFERETEAGLLTIKAVGLLPITCTPEHPILVSSGRKRKYKQDKKGKYKVVGENIGAPEWREAHKIKAGDWVAVPIPEPRFNTTEIVIERKGQTHRTVRLTTELAKLIGYYVGDGWYTPNKAAQIIGFALDEKYPELHDELTSLITTVFDCKVYNCKRPRNTRRIQFHDPAFGQWLVDVAGNRSHNKRIPDFILYHKNMAILTAFLQGYLATDGARLQSDGVLRGVQWGTVSRTLAQQLQLALCRYGALAPIKLHCREGQIMINPTSGKAYKVRAAYFIQCSDKRVLDALGEPYDEKRNVCWSFISEGKIWTRVTSVAKQKFSGTVYNLEVENSHTYTVNNCVVHNCMQLILARQINGHKVSEYITFLAATNRREDKAHVQGILEPVKGRFTILELETTLEDWLAWAAENDMPPMLTSFLRWKPDLFGKFEASKDMVQSSTPRNIAAVGRYQNNGLPRALEHEVFKGRAGEAFTDSYLGFLRIYRELPDLDNIIANPKTEKVPTDPGTQYALSGALGARMEDKTLAPILTYLERLPAEISVAAVKLGITGKKQHLQKTKAYIDWAVRNQNVIL